MNPIPYWNGKDVSLQSNTNFPSVSVGNANTDIHLEVFYYSGNNLYGWDWEGNDLLNISFTNTGTRSFSAPVIADIDNNHSDAEILISIEREIKAFKIDETEIIGWNLKFKGYVSCPLVADVDNDGKNELLFNANGKMYQYKTPGTPEKNEWPSFRCNPQNTGAYANPCIYSSIPLEIGSSYPAVTTWSVNKTLHQNLVIKQGKTLIIKSTVKFQQNCKIIVESGGTLILDACRLTNSDICGNSLWQGIEVWGNPNQNQSLTNQGFVRLTNGATIENAIFGIVAGKMTLSTSNALFPNNYSLDATTTGGIIWADGAKFINNQIGILLKKYSTNTALNNKSHIKFCEFKTTANLLNGVYPFTFIALLGIDNASIVANTFINENTSVTDVTKKGYGILACDATFSASASSTSVPTRNTFENLYYGIYAFSSNPLRTFTSQGNEFINNARGISCKYELFQNHFK